MQFLKGMGGGAKPAPAKASYFSSLKLDQEKPEAKKEKGSTKGKKGPPKGFAPTKFALDFNPPMIIMEYRNPDTNKLYHHKMVMKKLKKETTTKQALDYLKKKHYHYFIPKVIDETQIQKLVDRLKNGLLGQNKSGFENVDQEDDFDFDYDDDFEV